MQLPIVKIRPASLTRCSATTCGPMGNHRSRLSSPLLDCRFTAQPTNSKYIAITTDQKQQKYATSTILLLSKLNPTSLKN